MKNLIPFFVLGLLLTLFSCSGAEDAGDLKIFKYNQASGVSSLDPAFAKNQANIWAVNQLFNGLVQLDKDLNTVACIAKSWTVSDSGKVFTFHLRNDVFFHKHEVFGIDGTRTVTANDFVYSFQRIIDPKVASPGAWIFNGIIAENEPFIAIDDSTFQLSLNRPFRPILGILSMPYCFVVPKEMVAHFGKDFRSNPIGTGPFQLKVWEEGVALVALKNKIYFEDYQGVNLPYLDGYKTTFSDNKKMEFLNFQKGSLDMVSGIDKSTLAVLFDNNGNLNESWDSKLNLERNPFLNTEYLGIYYADENAGVLQNRAVRQAINYCFDREEMITYLRKGVGQAANAGFVPKGLPAFNSDKVIGYDYNPEKAKILLNEAGYDGEVIKLLTNDTYKDIALYITNQAQQIGLNVVVEVVQPKILRDWMTQGQANFFRGSWIADYPDAENYLALFYSQNGAPPNYTRFKNETFDGYYEATLSEQNDSIRYNLYQKMDSIVLYEAPVVVLYYDEVIRITQKNIEGATPNALNSLDLKYVKKD